MDQSINTRGLSRKEAKELKKKLKKLKKLATKGNIKAQKELDTLATGHIRDSSQSQAENEHKAPESIEAITETVIERMDVKVPKGTRDYHPEDITLRERLFVTIKGVFRRHGGVGIATPVFELKKTLANKYGEDSKLIYNLADQGGEMLTLRYDLTVPFARYVATHGVKKIKRYHIGRVYRRDNPSMTRGRFREFFQCDYDIAGTFAPMVADSEVLRVLVEVLEVLDLSQFKIKLNDRRLLDAIMAVCDVPEEKFRTICCAIDKLDKLPWEEVAHEMTATKGLPAAAATKLKTFVHEQFGEPREMMTKLQQRKELREHPQATLALKELTLLFDYLEAFGCLHRISLDMSLARGLDYYTGVIYECVLTTGGANVGSIAAGGRYDNLVGSFSSEQVPAVGVSLGIERIFNILKKRAKEAGTVRSSDTQVLVCSVGKEECLMAERMKLCHELWTAGISAEFLYTHGPSNRRQNQYAMQNKMVFSIFIGMTEVQRGVVTVKNVQTAEMTEMPRSQLFDYLRQHLE